MSVYECLSTTECCEKLGAVSTQRTRRCLCTQTAMRTAVLGSLLCLFGACAVNDGRVKDDKFVRTARTRQTALLVAGYTAQRSVEDFGQDGYKSRDSRYFFELAGTLNNFSVFDYAIVATSVSRVASVDERAMQLADELAHQCADGNNQVSLITHSFGGATAIRALARFPNETRCVSRLLTIASPIGGSYAATRLLAHWSWLRFFIGTEASGGDAKAHKAALESLRTGVAAELTGVLATRPHLHFQAVAAFVRGQGGALNLGGLAHCSRFWHHATASIRPIFSPGDLDAVPYADERTHLLAANLTKVHKRLSQLTGAFGASELAPATSDGLVGTEEACPQLPSIRDTAAPAYDCLCVPAHHAGVAGAMPEQVPSWSALQLVQRFVAETPLLSDRLEAQLRAWQ